MTANNTTWADCRRSTVVAIALLGLTVPAATFRPAHAQSRVDRDVGAGMYTVSLTGVPLEDALAALIDGTDISIAFQIALVRGRTSYCQLSNASPEEALGCVLRGTGLDYARLSSGAFILIRDPRARAQRGWVRGRVVDIETNEPIADVNVLLTDAGTGTASNAAGRFAVASLPPGLHRIVVTHISYEVAADTVTVPPGAGASLDIAMRPRPVMTEPVVISGLRSRLPSESLQSGQVTSDAITDDMNVGGVTRAADAVVGVRAGDALADVHVQGGATGEHQYLLDGATVFVPIRNGGFFGPFSPFAVRQITVRKAGYGAGYGSALSGVVEVDHRVGSAEEIEVVAQIDDLSVNGRLSGSAAIGDATNVSWMTAGRFGLWSIYKVVALRNLFEEWSSPDLFLVETLEGDSAREAVDASRADAGPVELDFKDFHVALRVRRSEMHSLFASLYRGRNTFGDDLGVAAPAGDPSEEEGEYREQYVWTNLTTQIRYEGVVNGRMLVNAGAWAGSYQFLNPFGTSPLAVSGGGPASGDFNDIEEVGARAGVDHALTDRHFLSASIEGVHLGTTTALELRDEPSVDRRPVNTRMSAFLEDRWTMTRRSSMEFGLRLTYLLAQSATYAEPRLAVRHDRDGTPVGRLSFRGAAGVYRQFTNQFDVATHAATTLVPSLRFWMPLRRSDRPPEAVHASFAVVAMPDDVWSVGVETFAKHHRHLIGVQYESGTEAPGRSVIARAVNASGTSYGIALTTQRSTERSKLQLHYEFSRSYRRTEGRFDGRAVVVPWNTPHRIFAAVDARISGRYTLTVRWQGIAGRAWGFRSAYYDYLEPDPTTRVLTPYDLSRPEDHRLPFFSQMDVGLAWSGRVDRALIQVRISLINVLNRDNVRDWSVRYDPEREQYERIVRGSVPFVPTFAVRFSI